MKKYRIAVLMTCYNRKSKTVHSITRLFACTLPDDVDIQVYLVDDGSDDGTRDAVEDRFPQVKIIQGTGSLFWNRGMHLAWINAEADEPFNAFLWLNDDTMLYPHALISLLQVAEKYGFNSIVTGSIADEEHPATIIYGGRDRNAELLSPATAEQPCDLFNGNLVLIPEAVYQVTGKNDPFFHHSLGDFDYGLRAAKAGFEACVAPGIAGYCSSNKYKAGNWNHPQTPLFKRLGLLYKPAGINPLEHFVFEYRHFGWMKAVFHFLTIHLRALVPGLWRNKINKL